MEKIIRVRKSPWSKDTRGSRGVVSEIENGVEIEMEIEVFVVVAGCVGSTDRRFFSGGFVWDECV